MAATGRKHRAFFLSAAALALTFAGSLRADQPSDVRALLAEVGTSLTSGDPSAAMTPFSKSFADYAKLRDYFIGLTNSFSIVNEIDVLDEQDSKSESLVTISWAITLTNPQNNFNTQRSGEIHVRVVRQKTTWKIAEFSPIALFDPSQAQIPSK